MNSQSQLFLDDGRRPYEPRHAALEAARPKPAPPAWAAVEHPRSLDLGLVGEGPTRIIPPRTQSLVMPLPSRLPQKARWWEIRFGPLGRALSALRELR